MRFTIRAFLFILLIVAATLGGVTFLLLENFNRTMEQNAWSARMVMADMLQGQMELRARNVLGTVVRSLKRYEEEPGFESLIRAVESVKAQPDAAGLFLFSPDGELGGSWTDPVLLPGDQPPPGTDLAGVPGKTVTLEDGVLVTENGNYLTVAQPIDLGEEGPVGVALVFSRAGLESDARDLADIWDRAGRNQTKSFLNGLLWVTALVFAVSLVMAYFAARSLGRPIRRLMAAAEEIGRGNYAVKVDVSRPDELGDLALSIQAMTREIEARTRELTREIAWRKEAQDAADKFRFIVDAARDPMSLVDRDYRFEAVNQAYCRTAGKDCVEISGRTLPEVWGDEVFEKHIRGHVDACLSGQVVRYRAWFTFPGMEPGCYQVDYYPYRNADGEVSHAVVISRDVTETEREREALKEKIRALETGSGE